jgi:hypothetical protein
MHHADLDAGDPLWFKAMMHKCGTCGYGMATERQDDHDCDVQAARLERRRRELHSSVLGLVNPLDYLGGEDQSQAGVVLSQEGAEAPPAAPLPDASSQPSEAEMSAPLAPSQEGSSRDEAASEPEQSGEEAARRSDPDFVPEPDGHEEDRVGVAPVPPPLAQRDEPLQYDEVLGFLAKCQVSTYRQLNKSMELGWSQALADQLKEVRHAVNDEPRLVLALQHLQLIAPCLLRVGARCGRAHLRQVNAEFRRRLDLWRQGALGRRQLVDEIVAQLTRRRVSDVSDEAARRRIRLKIGEGHYSSAARLLVSAGVMEPSERTYRVLEELHPQADDLDFDMEQLPQGLHITRSMTESALIALKSGSSPGPDFMRAEHLKQAMKDETGFVDECAKFFQLLANGVLPAPCRASFFACSLVPLIKGETARPLAMPTALVKALGLVFLHHYAGQVAPALRRIQHGVESRYASDVMYRTVQAVFDPEQNPNLRLLDVDIKSAYPTIRRDAVLAAVKEKMPGAARWIALAYGMKTKLFFHDRQLWSSTGGRQGDTLFALVYCVTLQPALEAFERRCPPGSLKLQQWIYDGGALVFEEPHGEAVLTVLLEELAKLDQEPGWAKCILSDSINLSEEFTERFGGRPRVAAEDEVIKVMGVPVWSSTIGFTRFFEEKLAKTQELLDGIEWLDDVHCGVVLQRMCASFCKVVHFARCASLGSDDDAVFANFLERFDTMVYTAWDRIARVSTNAWQRIQVGLSSKHGGFGLRSARLHADAAFIAGSLNSAERVSAILGRPFTDPALVNAIQRYNQLVLPADQLRADALTPLLQQHLLSERIDKARLEKYLQDGEVADRARIRSLQLDHSLDAIAVLAPSARRGQHLSNAEARSYFSFLLGCVPTGNCEECGAAMDRSAFHALCCSHGKRLKTRHDDAAHVVALHVQRAGFKVSEDVAIMSDGPNRPRPADLRIKRFKDGQDAALDFTFVAPLQKKFIKKAAVQTGVAVKAAEAKKRLKYAEQCRQHGVYFFPVAAETYGGWGAAAKEVFEMIIAAEAAVLERPMGPVRRQFYCDLAISIARNAARAILERLPEPDVDLPLPGTA